MATSRRSCPPLVLGPSGERLGPSSLRGCGCVPRPAFVGAPCGRDPGRRASAAYGLPGGDPDPSPAPGSDPVRLDPRAPLVLDTHELGRRRGRSAGVSSRCRRRRSRHRGHACPRGLAGRAGPAARVGDRGRAGHRHRASRATGSACGAWSRGRRRGRRSTCQELFVYADGKDDDADAEDDEASRLEGDLLDLEPVLRDAVVLALPFQPVCRDDCPGLCSECGARLADDPDHQHDGAGRPPVGGPAGLTEGSAPRPHEHRAPTQQHPTTPREPRPELKERTVAVPKRKMSRSNTRHRRSQWKAAAPTLVTCANPACGAKHLPHRACATCGQYGAARRPSARSSDRPVTDTPVTALRRARVGVRPDEPAATRSGDPTSTPSCSSVP